MPRAAEGRRRNDVQRYVLGVGMGVRVPQM